MFKCPDKLSVHLSRLGYTQAASLYFPKSVLEDATGLVGLFQLLSEFLQLVHILLHVHIPHLQHLRAELLHFILKMQSKIVYVHINFIQLNHMYYSHYNCSKMEVFDWKTWGKWMHSTSVVCTKGVSYIAISVSLQPTHPRQQWPHILSASMPRMTHCLLECIGSTFCWLPDFYRDTLHLITAKLVSFSLWTCPSIACQRQWGMTWAN